MSRPREAGLELRDFEHRPAAARATRNKPRGSTRTRAYPQSQLENCPA